MIENDSIHTTKISITCSKLAVAVTDECIGFLIWIIGDNATSSCELERRSLLERDNKIASKMPTSMDAS